MNEGRSFEYYALWCRLDNRDGYLIWMTDLERTAKDAILLDDEERVLLFGDPRSLKEYAAAVGFSLVEEQTTLFDLDWAAHWVLEPSAETVDCTKAIDAWNLFLDVWYSVKHRRDEFRNVAEPNRPVYDKLFFGNNLPAITPVEKVYTSIWSEEEVHALRSVLASGLDMFRSNLPAEIV